MPCDGQLEVAVECDNDRRTAGRDESLQVITRVAEVLRHLAASPAGLTVGELVGAAGLSRSTTYRILRSLGKESFTRCSDGRYSIGPGLIGLADSGRRDLRSEAAPYAEHLSRQLGETVDLAVLDGVNVLFVDQYSSTQTLRVVSRIGARFPAHCTANGKALLAALPQDEVGALLPARLRAYTEHTITRRKMLVRELDTIRERGYAFDLEEHAVGITAVGATVTNGLGDTAAITIVVPSARFDGGHTLAEALLETREQVQTALGATTTREPARRR